MLIISKNTSNHDIFIILSCIYVEISISIQPLTVLSSEIIQNHRYLRIPHTGFSMYCIYTRTCGYKALQLDSVILLEGRRHDAQRCCRVPLA
jgi:hypothetical protein